MGSSLSALGITIRWAHGLLGFHDVDDVVSAASEGDRSGWIFEVSHAGDALEKAYSGVGETVDCVVSYCVVSMLCCLVLSYEKEV